MIEILALETQRIAQRYFAPDDDRRKELREDVARLVGYTVELALGGKLNGAIETGRTNSDTVFQQTGSETQAAHGCHCQRDCSSDSGVPQWVLLPKVCPCVAEY